MSPAQTGDPQRLELNRVRTCGPCWRGALQVPGVNSAASVSQGLVHQTLWHETLVSRSVN